MDRSSFKYDILKEVFNISVGKAADLLSEITGKKILLKIPDVTILDRTTNNIELTEYLPIKFTGALMVSTISFKENLTGKANLIFPAEKMKAFIHLCLNEDVHEEDDLNFTDIDFDVIKEIGNIILNCILGETGNLLNIKLQYSLPEVKIYNHINFRKDIDEKKYQHILVLYITFIIDSTEIEGTIIVDLALQSLNEIMRKIDLIEADIYD
ncbi:MAG: chemotaxis protein CheC [Anaerocolumna aminovalerica]|jgi:chemotaxis protein CheC|uniref:chemotaxis protein CheC n=1 Tax=Anaerocolumna aminovalerica TaxID=1527 RepID=UPI00248CDF05|nr:chemotaxis protein CheC [Anaerocolumna aminovalerica]MDU6266610.1 chemotaxis protein CheC [Anaerocolumna aminovalerica]